MLSPAQLQQLGIAANEAFAVMERHDLLALPADVQGECRSKRLEFWRKRECAMVTGKCSFRELTLQRTRDEYRMVLLHFQTLSGNVQGAMKTAEREVSQAACHVPPGCGYVKQAFAALAAAGLKPGYLFAILKGPRFKASRLEDLSEKQLLQLLSTIRNRCSAKRDAGDPAKRNQTQRADRAAQQKQRTYLLKPAAPPPGDDIPF